MLCSSTTSCFDSKDRGSKKSVVSDNRTLRGRFNIQSCAGALRSRTLSSLPKLQPAGRAGGLAAAGQQQAHCTPRPITTGPTTASTLLRMRKHLPEASPTSSTRRGRDVHREPGGHGGKLSGKLGGEGHWGGGDGGSQPS